MIKIKLDQYGCCLDKDCPFRRNCAQHETAGDFRSEDGFSPELILDVNINNQYYCKTRDTTPFSEFGSGAEIPKNANELGSGFIPKTEIQKKHSKKEPLDEIVISSDNFEQLQELISNVGGRFFRKSELNEMPLGVLIEMLTPNVKQNIFIKIRIDKK